VIPNALVIFREDTLGQPRGAKVFELELRTDEKGKATAAAPCNYLDVFVAHDGFAPAAQKFLITEDAHTFSVLLKIYPITRTTEVPASGGVPTVTAELPSVMDPGPGTLEQPQVQRVCNGNSQLVGQCFRVHGRAFVSNGTPNLRIWRVGTKRILGVTASGVADDAEEGIAPDSLFRALAGDEHFVFGDFEVCPFTLERKGHMQMVCVERADNLVIEPYGYGAKER